jgi:lambda family phage portal protein
VARHYESASIGRRTDGWSRRMTDANTAAAGNTLAFLRAQARDHVRNNPWARRGLNRITANTVGWGIRPKATGGGAALAADLFRRWGETTQCDADERLTFYGLQRLVMRTVVESGEVLVRRRRRLISDGLAVPLQLQVLEPDYLDTGRDGMIGPGGGPIIQGVEFDTYGTRVAYWLFDEHPGSSRLTSATSRRVAAANILHVFNLERAGQVRGASWFAPVDVRLHDLGEFEDATLMKQKIAACMAAFVTDLDGAGAALGEGGTDRASDQPTDTFEPGMIMSLPAGKQVTVANPPQATDYNSFVTSSLRAVAAGLGVTYEDLSGDYSQVNYSSARMGRSAHMTDVNDWRWNMLIPQFCGPAWAWMVETAIIAGAKIETSPAEWTPPPVPMLDPGAEAAATSQLIRIGAQTLDDMVREQGYDPDEHWAEYAASLKRIDALGIVLDSDPRRMSQAGQAQAPPAKPMNGASKPNGATPPAAGGGN